ncbi:type II toxin-antitoxin system RelE/ParE family toxin [Bradyrhizobium prioriisuperbiae]|uniref:type II toxin-antitoxin system RelE/ParE family toxin n=1 Tax=Bradyrhizobium prioriisuperbiae TaxID=2854389 RepID=UPI0028ED136D|nr:type II toxin-antitoxin system RelE/ParE family toxin [Bradyrhizobium prioritasuperba]
MRRRDVIFSPEARDDLIELYDYIAAAAGVRVAMSYIERLEIYCLGFDIASERGHRREDIRPDLRIVGFERQTSWWRTIASRFCGSSPRAEIGRMHFKP